MCTHNLFLAKISKKYDIFIEKLSFLQHGDENSEQISEWSLHIHNASDA